MGRGDPEKVEDIGRDHGIAEEKRGPSGRQELVDSPTDKRSRQQQAFQKHAARWIQTDLEQRIADAG